MRSELTYIAVLSVWFALCAWAPAALAMIVGVTAGAAIVGFISWVFVRGMIQFLRDVWDYMPSD